MGFLDWIKTKPNKDEQTGDTAHTPPKPAPTTPGVPSIPSQATVVPKSVRPVAVAKPQPRPPEDQPEPAEALPAMDLDFSLADILPKLPEEVAARVSLPPDTRFTISSGDLASDVAHGRATISPATLESACPGVFAEATPAELPERIQLPLDKVVSQLGEFQTRSDQHEEEQPEQTFETPFLKGTLKDSAAVPAPRATKTSGPDSPQTPPPLPSAVTSSPHKSQQAGGAPAPHSPAGENPQSNRFATNMMPDSKGRRKPPATVRASVAGGKIKVGGFTTSLIKLPAEQSEHVQQPKPQPDPQDPQDQSRPSHDPAGPPPEPPPLPAKPAAEEKTPRSVSMQDSPFSKPKPPGTDQDEQAPPPQPPAKSQPKPTIPMPVSKPPGMPPAPEPGPRRAAPFPSPFAKAPETVVPTDSSRATKQPAPSQPPTATPQSPQKPAGNQPPTAVPYADQETNELKLPLASLIRSLPVDQIQGDPDSVRKDVFISLPLDRIRDQLKTGRISATVGEIKASLPEKYARIFGDADSSYDLTLPLHEIVAAIPPDLIRKRDDQIDDIPDQTYETPFSQKAAEDAERHAREALEAEQARAAADTPVLTPLPDEVTNVPEDTTAELPSAQETKHTEAPKPEAEAEAEAKPEPEAEAEAEMEANPEAEAEPEAEPFTPVTDSAAPPDQSIDPGTESTEAGTAEDPESDGHGPAKLAQPTPPLPTPVSRPSGSRPKPPMPFISRRSLRTRAADGQDPATPPSAAVQPPKPFADPSPQSPAPTQGTDIDEPPPTPETTPESKESPPPPLPTAMPPTGPPADPPQSTPRATEEPPEAPTPTESAPAETPPAVQAPATTSARPLPPEPVRPASQPPHARTPETSPADLPPEQAAPPAQDEDMDEDEDLKLNAVEALREIFMTEEKLDAKGIILHIKKFPGIRNVMISTADGLKLAGELSSFCDTDAICAISLSLISKIDEYGSEAGMKPVRSVTLSTPPNLVSLFSSHGICLIIEHARREFAPGTRSRLVSIVEHLSTIYS